MTFYKTLLESRIETLELIGIQVDENDPAEFENTVKLTNIRTLHLDILQSQNERLSRKSNAAFAASLLSVCASTLETLNWSIMSDERDGWNVWGPGKAVPAFPKLHTLTISTMECLNYRSLVNLLCAPLSRLSIGVYNTVAGDSLAQIGQIPTLMSLELMESWKESQNESILRFLGVNSQLIQLSLTLADNTPLLDECVLEVLSARSKNLSSFALHWDGKYDDLTDQFFRHVTEIQSLSQLSLTLKSNPDISIYPPVDHDRMRDLICQFPNMEVFVLAGDSYHTWKDETEKVHYHCSDDDELGDDLVEELFDGDLDLVYDWQFDDRQTIWERYNKQVMVKEADKDIALLPRLRWIYFGQLDMHVVRDHTGQRSVVVKEDHEISPLIDKFRRRAFR